MSEDDFEIVPGVYGPKLVLGGPWSPAVEEAARAAGVVEMSVGPRVPDLSFLEGMPGLLGLSHLHGGADLGPLRHLGELRRVYFANVRGQRVDFSRFTRLEKCVLEWSSGVSGVFEARSLVDLFVNRLPKASLPRVAELGRLRRLGILSCGAASLDPLRGLAELEELRIGLFHKLESNAFVEDLRSLRRLTVQNCGGFSSLEPVASLPCLEHLCLEAVGPIESLAPLARIRGLRSVVVMGGKGTRVLDPDLDPIWALPLLERFAVPGRRGVFWKAADGPKPWPKG